MSLEKDDALTLRRAGFIEYEVLQFNQAVAPDGTPQVINIRSATWSAAIASRRQFVQRQRIRGWSPLQIGQQILSWYKRGLIESPFDFVKKEYKPPRLVSDFQEARRQRVKKQVAVVYGRR